MQKQKNIINTNEQSNVSYKLKKINKSFIIICYNNNKFFRTEK